MCKKKIKLVMSKFFTLVFLIATAFATLFAQKGPGGVSVETVNNSTCKMWYDAGALNFADGSFVDLIDDISLSANNNFAFQDTASFRPMFRSDVSAGINGEPALIFGTASANYMKLNSSVDINMANPMNERTMFITFKTGTNIGQRQVIYEQGGGLKGLNVSIYQGKVYVTVYDRSNDADGTPSFGPVSVSNNIFGSATYVLALRFFGPSGSLGGFLEAYLNGVPFSSSRATGVGSIWSHGDLPGLGGIHSDALLHDGTIYASSTGAYYFQGSMAEVISYSDTLNAAQRIIVENYLDSKYAARSTTNDFYSYENTHGKRVFGIGRQNNQVHNTSQGAGIFEISGNTANFQNGEFMLIGDNDGSLTASTINIPNSSSNTKRVAREWRVAHTGYVGPVTVRVEASKLPALGNGFTKYVLIKDNKAGLTSKFAGSNVEVIELVDEGNGYYSTTTNLTDGSFLTFGLIKPQVSFTAATDYGFEENVNTTESVFAELNYLPATTVNFNYSFVSGSAFAVSDYIGANGLVTFNPGVKTAVVSFVIVGDTIGESSETFTIQLSSGIGSTPGIDGGLVSTLEFSIYDNDNDPEVSFATNIASVSEDADSVLVDIVRSGNASVPFTVNCRVRTSGGGAGSATNSVDYSFTTPVTVAFGAGEVLKQVVIYLNDDNTDEEDETVFLELYGVVGLVDLVTPNEYELTILDDDVPPTVQFLDANYFAPESFGEPDILLVLSAPSDKDIQVGVNRVGGTASPVVDFSLITPSTITIPAGDSVVRVPLITLQDAITETDETVDLRLVGSPTYLVNATLGAQINHTFTIKDYQAFEWLGPAGVGQINEVPLWMDAERESGLDGQSLPTITNHTTQPNYITQAPGAGTATLEKSVLIQGRANYLFQPADGYVLPSTGNLNGTATNRDIWIAFRPGPDVTSRQVIYEQGGGARGLNLYILNGQVYFHLYNSPEDDGPGSAFGPSQGGAIFVSAPISPQTPYILHAKYDVNATNSVELYLNESLVGSIPASTFSKTLYGHNWASVGTVNGGILYHDGLFATTGNHYYIGRIMEVIAYQNSPMNGARQTIINNYLSAKYAMATAGSFHTVSTVADDFGNNLAGIGSAGANAEHTDAQGTSRVRIKEASSLDAGDYLLWHDNGAAISDSVTTNLPIAFTSRLSHIFRVEEEGEVGTVRLSFDISGFNMSPYILDDVELLISNNANDFSGASRHVVGRSMAGNTLTFTGVNLNEGQYFTIGFAPNDCIEGLWTGSAGTDWNNPANWDCNEVPTSLINAVIPAGATNFPVLDAGVGYPVADITIEAGAQIFNTSIASVTPIIQVHGNWSNTGSINGLVQLSFVGSTAQTISGDNSFNVLQINNPAGVSIVGGSVQVAQALNLQSGTLTTGGLITLQSTATKTAYINDFAGGYSGSISGNITIERNISSAVSGFHYMGFGLNNATIGQIDDDMAIVTYNGATDGAQVTPTASCSFTQLAAGSAYGNVFDYRENAVTNCELSGWHVRTSGSIGVAQGLAITAPAGITIDQTGAYTTGSINSVQLKYTGSNNSGKRGRNLLTNPYHSDINWGDVASNPANSNITGEAFVFVTSGTYAGTFTTYNLANNANLAPGQGFFVITTANNSTVSFNNSMRRASSGTFYRGGTTFAKKLEVEVAGNNYADITTIIFDDAFTASFDHLYDGRKMMSPSGTSTLYTHTDDSIGMQSINALPNDGSITSVPMGFVVGANGSYTFTANLVNGFGATAMVLLEDLKLGTMHNLRAGDYTFAAVTTDDADRFIIHFIPEAVLTSATIDCDGLNGEVAINLGTTDVSGTVFGWDNAIVLDPSGAQVASVSNASGVVYSSSTPVNGTYTVQLTHGAYNVTDTVVVSSKPRVDAAFTADAMEVFEGAAVSFTNNTNGATAYEWAFGDGMTDMTTDPVYVYNTEGMYTVTLAASNAECNDDASQTILVKKQASTPTGVADVADAMIAISAYSNTIRIEMTNVADEVLTLNIYNLVGQRVIAAEQVQTAKAIHSLTLNNIADGNYFVELTGATTQQVQQVYIQR